jgi:hypothetical protein
VCIKLVVFVTFERWFIVHNIWNHTAALVFQKFLSFKQVLILVQWFNLHILFNHRVMLVLNNVK